MNKYIFYPSGINDFETEFNNFIEAYPWIEITCIHFSSPFINCSKSFNSNIVASIIYL